MQRRFLPLTLAILVLAAAAACRGSASSPPADDAAAPDTGAPEKSGTVVERLATVPAIVDPANLGWPRTVEVANGRVTVRAQPERIHTTSVGLDEVVYALVPRERVVAVGRSTRDPGFSNVAGLAQDAPVVGRDPEEIAAQRPDIVLTVPGPLFRPEQVKALEELGITVVSLEQDRTIPGRMRDILLVGYLLGEEERAVELAGEVERRYRELQAVVGGRAGRPRVLPLTRFGEGYEAAGAGSTQDGIIQAAGGVNAAAEAGLTGAQRVSLESIIAMAPDVIVVTMPEESGEQVRQDLLREPVLQAVPAVRDGRVYVIPAPYTYTLSYWNLRGAEELAKRLWPDALGDRTFEPLPGGR